MIIFLFVVGIFLTNPSAYESLEFHGEIKNASNWVLIASFCVKPPEAPWDIGRADWTIWPRGLNQKGFSLLIYFDELWKVVQNSTMNCTTRMRHVAPGGKISISPGVTNYTYIQEKVKRIWYFVVANCDEESIYATYQLNYTHPTDSSGNCTRNPITPTRHPTRPTLPTKPTKPTYRPTATHFPTLRPTKKSRNVTESCQRDLTKSKSQNSYQTAESGYHTEMMNCFEDQIPSDPDPKTYRYSCPESRNLTSYRNECRIVDGQMCSRRLTITKHVTSSQLATIIFTDTFECIPKSCLDDYNLGILESLTSKSYGPLCENSTCSVVYACFQGNNSPAVWLSVTFVLLCLIGGGAFFIWWRQRGKEETEFI